jgi:hypothetical protein
MIYPTDSSTASAAVNVRTLTATKAHKAKTHGAHKHVQGAQIPSAEALLAGSLTVPVQSGLKSVQNFSEAPPIADAGPAAAATQQASLLIRSSQRLALETQANTSSQSVERLLQ